MVMKTVQVADAELELRDRDRVLREVPGPELHRQLPQFMGRTRIRTLDLQEPPVRDPALAALYLTHPEIVREHFAVADVADGKVGLVFADRKLVGVFGPGTRAFYAKSPRRIEVRLFDATTEFEVPKELVTPVARLNATSLVMVVDVPSDAVGLLWVDGVHDRELAPGRYAFFRTVRRVDAVILDLRPRTHEGTGPSC